MTQGYKVSHLKHAAALSLLPLSAMPAQAQTQWSVTSSLNIDENTRKGDSDAQGDLKAFSVVARNDTGLVVGVDTGIVTPEFSNNRDSFDTGYATATIGYESPVEPEKTSYGVYGSIGVVNGFVLDGWHKAVRSLHGNGPTRMSPASSGARVALGLAARADRSFSLAEVGTAHLNAHSTVYGIARTDEVSAGAGGFLSLDFDAAEPFRPHVPGLPKNHQRSAASLYAGALVKARIYDLPTDRLNSTFAQVSAVAGVSLRRGQATFGFEYQKPLTSEIETPLYPKPVGRYLATIGYDF